MLVRTLTALLLLTPLTPPARAAGDVPAAMARGAAWLVDQQDTTGRWPSPYSNEFAGGVEALCSLALLSAGVEPDHPAVQAGAGVARTAQTERTYVRALRLVLMLKLGDHPAAGDDLAWLIAQQAPSGGWNYGSGRMPIEADGSNTLLAVWALCQAERAGLDVPESALSAASDYWLSGVNLDGGWGYRRRGPDGVAVRPGSYGSMTAAGVYCCTCLGQIFARDVYDPPYTAGPAGRADAATSIDFAADRGGLWLAGHTGFDAVPADPMGLLSEDHLNYYLLFLARAADATGRWRLAGHDLAAGIRRQLLAGQRADGSWSGSADQTAQAMLALELTSRPMGVSVVSATGAEAYDRHSIANLVAWMNRQPGRAVRWQRIGPNAPAGALLDAPAAWLRWTPGMTLPTEQASALAELARRGGTVIVQCAAPEVAAEAIAALQALAPDATQAAPAGVEASLYHGRYDIDTHAPPRIIAVGGPLRTFGYVIADDLAGAWQRDRTDDYALLFHLGVNLLTDSPGLQPPPRKAPPTRPRMWLTVARVQAAPGWSAGDWAIPRVSDRLSSSLGLALIERSAETLNAPLGPNPPAVVWLTGVGAFELTESQRTHLQDYIQAGGTLWLDPADGSSAFVESARALLAQLFDRTQLVPVSAENPLVTGQIAGGAGADLREAIGRDAPARLLGGYHRGRLAAVLCEWAVTGPADGRMRLGPGMLEGQTAEMLAGNVLLLVATGP